MPIGSSDASLLAQNSHGGLRSTNGTGRAIEDADHFSGGMTIPHETLDETADMVARHVRSANPPSSSTPAAGVAAGNISRISRASTESQAARQGAAGAGLGPDAWAMETETATVEGAPWGGSSRGSSQRSSHSSDVSRQGKGLCHSMTVTSLIHACLMP